MCLIFNLLQRPKIPHFWARHCLPPLTLSKKSAIDFLSIDGRIVVGLDLSLKRRSSLGEKNEKSVAPNTLAADFKY